MGDEEVEVGPGDYLGFPIDGLVHHLRNAGDGDLVYLMGGERSDLEVARFPTAGKLAVFRAGERVAFFAEEVAERLPLSAWLAADD